MLIALTVPVTPVMMMSLDVALLVVVLTMKKIWNVLQPLLILITVMYLMDSLDYVLTNLNVPIMLKTKIVLLMKVFLLTVMTVLP